MKIICVGRNYAEHARELNNAVPDDPVIFLKPDSSLIRENQDFMYPEFSSDVHYECELVIQIGKEGKFINPEFAHTYISGVGLGIDFTARDLQSKLKAKQLPWTLAKGFHGAAPVSDMLDPGLLPNLQDIHFRLDVNGACKQNGHTADMMFSVPFLLGFISTYMSLKKGDLIFTGTPAGVGPVQIGDHLEGYLGDRRMLDFYVR